MATEAQIRANQQNAQHSTGASTEAGAARSSQNATKHGYTGRSLVLKPEEIEDYNAHVAAYIAEYEPFTQRQSQLVHQKADLDWSLHQISIEQSNTMTHMNLISSQKPDPANPLAIAKDLAPFSKILNTMNLYETRRRRAAKAVTEELEALIKSDVERRMKEINEAAKLYKVYKAKGQAFDPAEFGFDCSLQEILDAIKGTEARQMVSGAPATLEAEAITQPPDPEWPKCKSKVGLRPALFSPIPPSAESSDTFRSGPARQSHLLRLLVHHKWVHAYACSR